MSSPFGSADAPSPGPAPATAVPLWHALDSAATADRLETTPQGLSREEAQRRLARDGANALPETPPTSALVVLLHQFTSPLIYILLLAAVITLLVGEFVDAGVIAAVLALNAIIGFSQERRAEQSVRALIGLMAPKAHVVRDGREWSVEGRDLVVGDVVLLESGARVPADLRLIATTALRIDESLLTGESLPVTRVTDAIEAPDQAVADRTNMAFMGSVVASGRARGYVVSTGTRTELGAISESIRGEADTETPLQQRMTRFAQVIGVVVGISAGAAFAIGVAFGQSASHMLLIAVALAVAAIPEGLPVVFTVTLALAVRRMARRKAIVRRLPAVETLGSTTVIGSDKTGTLTENRMTVQEVWADGQSVVVPGADAVVLNELPVLDHATSVELTLLAGVLTNEAELYRQDGTVETQGDPTEAALLVAAATLGIEPSAARAVYASVEEVPFEPERQYSASVRKYGEQYVLFVKGAPERLLAMSTHLAASDPREARLDESVVLAAAHAMASRGLRVLGMAYRLLPAAPTGGVVPSPDELTFAGLQGMLDPPRAGVRDAIAGCQAAGIRVVMITGDHAETALAIGSQLGIAAPGSVPLTGGELERMSDADLQARVQTTSIYARVSPDHKLRVVQALRAAGEVVAVTGDGVNDAPALKAADIGVAMGRSGTDVAREAADMVLADDNFVSIYAAVEEGRVTFDNLRKVTFFLVSTGAAAIIMSLTGLVMGWPLVLVPAQLLWLNLVTNGLQDVALAFEPGEPGVLDHPPRPRREGVMSRKLWERTVVSGLVMATGTLALFHWELNQGGSLMQAQTAALSTMVLFQMFHVGNCRSDSRSVFSLSPFSNPFLIIATTAALVIHVGALYFGPTQFVLRVEPLALDAWIRIVGVALSIVVAIELHKIVRKDP